MTQNERVLTYMRTKGSISSKEALSEFGCMRLAARIRDLRDKGYRIHSESETSRNMFGEKVSFTRYSLEEKK